MSNEFGKAVRAERERRDLSQNDLAKLAQSTQSTVDRIEKGLVRFSPHMPRIAEVLGLSSLLPSPGNKSSQARAPRQEVSYVAPIASVVRNDDEVPVYPAVEGGDGAMLINRDPIDWLPRPEPLIGAKEGYYAYIVGDSMVPAYRPGEQVMVHPKLPTIPDETYIFYTNDPSDDRAKIKHLIKVTPDDWIVEEYSPERRQFPLDRREWPVAHRIVGKHTRR